MFGAGATVDKPMNVELLDLLNRARGLAFTDHVLHAVEGFVHQFFRILLRCMK